MSSPPQAFSAEALARHPEWKLLTTAKKHQLTGRRLFALRVPKGTLKLTVGITDKNILFYSLHGNELRTTLPDTYQGFMRALKGHNLMIHALVHHPPRVIGREEWREEHPMVLPLMRMFR